MDEKNHWQKMLYKKIGSKQVDGVVGAARERSIDEVLAMSKVLQGLHLVSAVISHTHVLCLVSAVLCHITFSVSGECRAMSYHIFCVWWVPCYVISHFLCLVSAVLCHITCSVSGECCAMSYHIFCVWWVLCYVISHFLCLVSAVLCQIT